MKRFVWIGILPFRLFDDVTFLWKVVEKTKSAWIFQTEVKKRLYWKFFKNIYGFFIYYVGIFGENIFCGKKLLNYVSHYVMSFLLFCFEFYFNKRIKFKPFFNLTKNTLANYTQALFILNLINRIKNIST